MKEVIKKAGKGNWPLVGIFVFAFFALLGSIAIILNVWPKVYSAVPLAQTSPESSKKNARAFLWKDHETPLPVIIDNMQEAWPPEGLEYARVVFEAPVEAGITRLLAVFGSNEAADFNIGPVRSVRPYFASWAEEFGTFLAHVGGSPEGLETLKAEKIFDLDEFRYGGVYFKRVTDRFAPHNAFTSLAMLTEAFHKHGTDGAISFNSWKTKDDSLAVSASSSIRIAYPSPYNVRFDFDPRANDYSRFVNGKPFVTKSGVQIHAKNVVVMKTDITIIDALSRRRIDTESGGDALIFEDGKAITGMWSKKDGFTKFYNEMGNEVFFNKGPIWIEVVSNGTSLDIK